MIQHRDAIAPARQILLFFGCFRVSLMSFPGRFGVASPSVWGRFYVGLGALFQPTKIDNRIGSKGLQNWTRPQNIFKSKPTATRFILPALVPRAHSACPPVAWR